jgi:outer membrane usher protein
LDPLTRAIFRKDAHRPPRAIDQAQISAPTAFGSYLSLNYAGVDQGPNRVRALGLAYSFDLGPLHLQASAIRDLRRAEPLGFQLTLTAPLGRGVTASTGVAGAGSKATSYVEASRQTSFGSDAWGWRARASGGDVRLLGAGASYEGLRGRIDVDVQDVDGRTSAWVQANGGAAFIAGRPFLSRRLDGPFAVIDAGTPGLEVRHENRPVGRTGRKGVLLVPALVANQANRISVDPTGLPVDAEFSQPETRLKPALGAGVVLKLRPPLRTDAALVGFVDAAGQPLPIGARGRLRSVGGDPETFVVGYDGEAFVRGLELRNSVVVQLPNGRSCQANFPFARRLGEQVRLEAVVCRPVTGAQENP